MGFGGTEEAHMKGGPWAAYVGSVTDEPSTDRAWPFGRPKRVDLPHSIDADPDYIITIIENTEGAVWAGLAAIGEAA